MTKLLVIGAATALLAAGTVQAAAPTTASADLTGGGGASLGRVMLIDAPQGVLLKIEAKGLTPGWHGLHLHEVGDCSRPTFASAGGHVHGPGAAVHGLLNPSGDESGDLPNLFVAADGSANAEIFSATVSLRGAGGRPALLDQDGSSIVVHASADDHMSQPIGGAGARLACGVIRP